jgi:methylenetetrahydrofolate reductase (NADPH)
MLISMSLKECKMRIIELYRNKKPVISFEVFPPKPDTPISEIYSSLEHFSKLNPAFISVTYGAGGGRRQRTLELSSLIKNKYGIESMAHLTCMGHTRDEIDMVLNSLQEKSVENVLALRGDPPADNADYDFSAGDFQFASDLVNHIARRGYFCIGAAAYVEGHVESSRISIDLDNLKKKVNAGVDFLITQLFFDNKRYYDFVERAAALGIDCPIVPGIMPVFREDQIKSIAAKSGCSIPASLVLTMDKYGKNPDEMRQAGIEYAASQIRDLVANGAPGVHIYTMNRPVSTRKLMQMAGLL